MPNADDHPPAAKPCGVLLVQLGTPSSPSVRDVRRYLRPFLSDPRVIDLGPVGRWLLVNLVILPFRPRRSAEAYAKIWTEQGSPLLVHSRELEAGVRERLGAEVVGVELGMRYGEPAIEAALGRLVAAGASRIVVFPLFPQFSRAAWESAVVAVERAAGKLADPPELDVVPPFYARPDFIEPTAERVRPVIDAVRPERVLMTFHGLPVRQVQRGDPSGAHCLRAPDCCARIENVNRSCYRAQCFRTARALAESLGLEPRVEAEPPGLGATFEVAFQSRLGRTPWIGPYTDRRIAALPGEGVRRLVVVCPSFVADCLETIEEIGIRGRDAFIAAGGQKFALVPCVNAAPEWVDGAASLVRERLPKT